MPPTRPPFFLPKCYQGHVKECSQKETYIPHGNPQRSRCFRFDRVKKNAGASDMTSWLRVIFTRRVLRSRSVVCGRFDSLGAMNPPIHLSNTQSSRVIPVPSPSSCSAEILTGVRETHGLSKSFLSSFRLTEFTAKASKFNNGVIAVAH